MKERIKELIEEYKEVLEFLRERWKAALDEGNEFEMQKFDLSARYFEWIIKDLEELLTL